MRFFSKMVFDEVVTGAGIDVFTSSDLNEELGTYDSLAVQAVVDRASGAGQITVAIQHSGDGEIWTDKNSPPEISAAAFVAGSVTFLGLAGGDGGFFPSLQFVRLR